MAQESYADFSIIQKYLDQKRYHDEEIRSYKAKITEHENSVNTLRNKLAAKEQVISQLNTQLNECKAQIKEKEKVMQELSIQAHRLRKRMEQRRPSLGAADRRSPKDTFVKVLPGQTASGTRRGIVREDGQLTVEWPNGSVQTWSLDNGRFHHTHFIYHPTN